MTKEMGKMLQLQEHNIGHCLNVFIEWGNMKLEIVTNVDK